MAAEIYKIIRINLSLMFQNLLANSSPMNVSAPAALAPIQSRMCILTPHILGEVATSLVDFLLVERTRKVKVCSGRAVTMSLKVLYPSKDAGKAKAIKAE